MNISDYGLYALYIDNLNGKNNFTNRTAYQKWPAGWLHKINGMNIYYSGVVIAQLYESYDPGISVPISVTIVSAFSTEHFCVPLLPNEADLRPQLFRVLLDALRCCEKTKYNQSVFDKLKTVLATIQEDYEFI